LATVRDQKPLPSQQGPFYSVAPWTSSPKIAAEGMALDSLFISKVTRIEFSNYREQFSSLFLKRRTDPAAMRGEKFFVQNCLSCHATGPGPSVVELSGAQKSRSLASVGHPQMKGVPKLGDKEIRSLTSYLEAFHSENPSGSVKAVSAR
jgi:mono/diheme cytochrome c family protein